MENQPVAASGVKYAGFWIRFVARFVDGLVLMVPLGLIQASVLLPILSAQKDQYPQNFQATIIGAYVLIILVSVAYFVLMTHYKGATLGKMLVGIKVVSEDMTKLSFGKVLLRETVGKIVSAIILDIGFIIAAFTAKKQGLHDFMAKSVVVYKDPNNQSKTGLIVGIVVSVILGGLVMIAIIGILSSVVLVSLNSARQIGKDAQVKSYLMSIRPNAEIYYAAHNNSYSVAQNCFTGMFIDPNVAQLIGQLQNANPVCHAEGSTYAVSASLLNPPSEYCVDSTAFSGVGRAQSVGGKASCGAAPTTSQADQSGRVPATSQYTYKLPSGWQYAPENSQGIQAFQEKEGYVFIGTVGNLSDKSQNGSSIEDVVNLDSYKSQIKSKYPTATIESVTLGSIGGDKAIVAKISGSLNDGSPETYVAIQYLALHEGNGYTFVFVAQSKNRSTATADFDAIAKSLTFK